MTRDTNTQTNTDTNTQERDRWKRECTNMWALDDVYDTVEDKDTAIGYTLLESNRIHVKYTHTHTHTHTHIYIYIQLHHVHRFFSATGPRVMTIIPHARSSIDMLFPPPFMAR